MEDLGKLIMSLERFLKHPAPFPFWEGYIKIDKKICFFHLRQQQVAEKWFKWASDFWKGKWELNNTSGSRNKKFSDKLQFTQFSSLPFPKNKMGKNTQVHEKF